MTDLDRHLMDVVAPAADLREGTQLLGQETARLHGHQDATGRRVELLPRVHGPAWAQFAALGFERVTPAGDDPLLQDVRLPAGWHRATTDHHLYDHLVDGDGAHRVLICYKDTPHDRDAWMRVL